MGWEVTRMGKNRLEMLHVIVLVFEFKFKKEQKPKSNQTNPTKKTHQQPPPIQTNKKPLN